MTTLAANVFRTRQLPQEEWPRLKGTELEAVWPYLKPQESQVIVVEQDGEIVGCWALFKLVHAEGLWIAPEHRGKAGVALQLLKALRQAAGYWEARTVLTAAVSEDVRQMIEAFGGAELPGTHHVLTMEKRVCQRL